jgi:long-subunit acyl-CoA synthetase (AMP-forming)
VCRSVKLSTGGFIMSTNTVERSVEACALDAATLCEAFQISAATHPERVAVRTSGDAVVLTWAQYAEQVRRTAAGLVALGVRRGDVVALMLTNRPEFLWVDAAAMHLGATTLGVYTTFAQEQVDYVLRDAGAVVAVTEKAFVSTLLQARKGCPRLVHLVSVDGGQGMLSLEDVDTAGDPGFDLSASWPTVDQHDVVSLVYTSGTTGPPKGVQLTHAGVIANARALHEAIPAYRAGFSAVCYLPLAHIAARVLEHYFGLLLGGTPKSSRRASPPPSPSSRVISFRRRLRPGCGWSARSRPASNRPLRWSPSTRGPMPWCCRGCGRVSAWTASRPRRSGPPGSRQR